MSAIQRQFDQKIAELTPRERIARAAAMFKWVRDLMARQIRAEFPHADDREIKLRVGLRMYASDPGIKRHLEGMLERVSDRSI